MFLLSLLLVDLVLTSFYRDLGHSADPEEVEDLERFLNKTLPPEGDGQAAAGL
jgi:predicted esterase